MVSLITPTPSTADAVGVSLSEAVLDTPTFRANIRYFEDQVDHFEKWLDALLRSLRSFSEEISKLNEAINVLTRRTLPSTVENSIIDGDFSSLAVRTFADAFQTTLAFRAKLVNDMEERLIAPISHFMKNDLKDFKEYRRNYERNLERYENTLAKYTSQSKTKEASALREDAFQLFEVRKTHIRISLDYTLKIIQLRSAVDHLLLGQFSDGTCVQLEFHESTLQVYKALENKLNRLKDWLTESKKATDFQLPRLQKKKKKLEEEAIAMAQPGRNLTKYTDTVALGTSKTPITETRQSSYPSPELDQANEPQKNGYLFMRIVTGKPARFAWVRKYFCLKDGSFWWTSVGQGKQRGAVEENERIGVLLCEIRVDQTQERRFCFEVVCGAKQTTYLLQAETEAELKDWIATFESAKKHAFSNSTDLSVSAAATVVKTEHDLGSPLINNGEEAKDNSKEASAPQQDEDNFAEVNTVDVKGIPSPGLLPPSAAQDSNVRSSNHSSANSSRRGSGTLSSRPSTSIANFSIASTMPSIGNTSNNSSTPNQQNFWGTLQLGLMPAVNLLMSTVNGSEDGATNSGDENDGMGKRSSLMLSKGGRSRSGSLSIGSGTDGIISNYSQDLLFHNSHLHSLFEETSEPEVVLDVFQCAWLKEDVLLKGRAYITQHRLYFYSDAMSIINKFCLRWRELKHVTQTLTDLQQSVEFVHGQEKYVLKTFLETGDLFYAKVRFILESVVGDKSMTLQAIFDALWSVEVSAATTAELTNKKESSILENKTETKVDAKSRNKTPPAHEKDPKVIHNEQQDVSRLSGKRKTEERLELQSQTTPETLISLSPEEGDEPPSNISHPKDLSCSNYSDKQDAVTEPPGSAKKLFDMIFDEKSRLQKKKENKLLRHHKTRVHNKHTNGEESSTSIPSTATETSEPKPTIFRHRVNQQDEKQRDLILVFASIFRLLTSRTLRTLFVLSLLLNIYLWIYSGNGPTITPERYSRNGGYTGVWSRAVYLRDLEEGILNHTISTPNKAIDSSSYSQFLDTRLEHPPYPWLLHSHRRFAGEILLARERIAILRYDLLHTFQLLNSIDKRLLQSEYVNWLMDERAKCGKARWMVLREDNEESGPGDGDSENKTTSSKDSREQDHEIVRYCQGVKTQLDLFSGF